MSSKYAIIIGLAIVGAGLLGGTLGTVIPVDNFTVSEKEQINEPSQKIQEIKNDLSEKESIEEPEVSTISEKEPTIIESEKVSETPEISQEIPDEPSQAKESDFSSSTQIIPEFDESVSVEPSNST